MCVWMFYEILQDGFHTPLTATQIGELFQAGRVGRHTRCKPVKQSEWRTIDELFPLLKHHTQWQSAYQSPEPTGGSKVQRSSAVAIALVATATAVLGLYFYLQGSRPADRRITAIDSLPLSATQTKVQTAPILSTHTIPPATVTPVERTNPQAAIRLAEAQRIADQDRRNQIVADQERARERDLLEQEKAAGRDERVPLDQWQVVNVGTEAVRVKIHDNDVSSFAVWINWDRGRQMPKAHGITHSRTDETLIYSNGRAALYYVWEISGRLNHCLLRVRES